MSKTKTDILIFDSVNSLANDKPVVVYNDVREMGESLVSGWYILLRNNEAVSLPADTILVKRLITDQE